ncbi:MAG TPA: hypothetical protein DER40_00250, partial [Geobacter sp.]|nr:hypothetical protein [Geobacter sp.]
MVVSVSSTRTSAGTQTTATATYGGQNMTLAVGDAGSTSVAHSYLFYLDEAGIAAAEAASNTTLAVTIAGGTARYNYVHASIYSGVDQGTVFNDTAQQNSGATAASPTFSPALTIVTGEQAIEVYNTTRVGSTTTRTMTTPAANWTQAISGTAWSATDSGDVFIMLDSTAGSTTSAHTMSGTAIVSMSAMSLKASVPDTTSPVVSAFTLPATSEGLTFPVSSFTATDAVGVTGYMVTESSTAPLAGDAGWSGTAPATVTASGAGSKTFYPWAKDAAGNISATFGTPRTVTVTAISPLLHNSANLNSTKWAPAGWGVTGGKYGKFDCSTCHTASTSNLKRIKTPITLANMSTFNAAGTAIGVTSTVPVTFRNLTSMGKDPSPTAYNASVRVCQACHTITAKHNSNNQRPMVTDHAHNNGSDCVQCHAHNTGFKGGGDCLGCHKTPQGATAGTARVAILGQFTASRNSHHVQGVAITPQACYACHWEAKSDGSMSTYHAGVPNGAVDLVITQAGGVRPSGTTYTEGTTGTAYTSNTTRNQTQLAKINNHCLGCHGPNGFGQTPFANAGVTGETSNPEKYSWEKIKYGTAQSIAAKYSDTTTT